MAMTNSEDRAPSAAGGATPAVSDGAAARFGKIDAAMIDELYTDPQVLLRVGAVIATAMKRASSAKY
jgi:hypothetical protein